MNLYENELHFDSLALPYVQKHRLEAAALLWYLSTYGDFAAREVFHEIGPDLAGCIARLFVTDEANEVLFASFAESIGMTPGDIVKLLDPAKEVTPA